MTLTDPSLAAAIAATGVPLSADYALQPATPRWHQLRTELIAMVSPYMPVLNATAATNTLDELIVELGAPGLTPRGGVEAASWT